MHCERWIPLPLWRNYKMMGKSESSQPWLFESVVTQPRVKPQAGRAGLKGGGARGNFYWRAPMT